MNKQDEQILKNWTQYSEPSSHFYNDEKMVAFAKYYAEIKRTKVKSKNGKALGLLEVVNCPICGGETHQICYKCTKNLCSPLKLD